MSDYCQQCSTYIFGEDMGDLSGLSSAEDTIAGLFANVICEGCGFVQVDHEGRCISACDEYHNFTPGSNSALDNGCLCPVLDNGHGQGRGDGTFWINAECPLHGTNKN